MVNHLLSLSLALLLALLFLWAFPRLPKVGYQFLASLPHKQNPDGSWTGINLSWYGLFNALAVVAAASLLLVISGASGWPLLPLVIVILMSLGVAYFGARWMAQWVEGKAHAFTLGGALFLVLLTLPTLLFLARSWVQLPILDILAGCAIAYALGEGVGRLACISFGCCYGAPMDGLPPWFGKVFRSMVFRFEGPTRKCAYADHFEQRALFPIQGLTAVLCSGLSVLGLECLLWGHPRAAFLIVMIGTQTWRFVSEFIRRDFRGQGRLSVYQIFSLVGLVPVLLLGLLLPSQGAPFQLLEGLKLLAQPWTLLGLQLLGLAVFVHMGRSQVTGSRIEFHVHPERI